ncbi:MAG: hypothetical protein A3D35_03555 [Candidatus Staskawiczbacteria bacterium RIFCSPHIGHO2_02_FULL_34_9]|uniref:GTPase Obg n=1 Tax=Candidatus Staskawiczbacteria bacterium RIFCSPHIGHO2_02_FULL_34_9 TaxID=1802206 RepID=A0A1G2HXI1_9BACT|nr:MAG: hypothetical protein A3D35_03555 [Candidatus Staskawiczbacteria bacterium RIFCSPHIGHO2_02_FULL_34_9]
MIIDDIIIKVSGGDGGKGLVRFNKTKMTLGPSGGSGGKGGDVFLEGVSDLSALRQFRFKKVLQAENGQDGKFQLNDGHKGEDLILFVPVGTVVHNLDTKQDFEVVQIGQRLLVAQGGRGGKGNFLYRSAVNTSPMEAGKGKEGEIVNLRLELKMIADVGFIGLPNAGKSSLLNMLTAAKSKVANYPFTTLEPNLGVYYELILGDIPGIIEGAASGKGLGVKFLQHIERTKVLFHLIASDSKDPVADYKTVRKELELYNPLMLEKPEYIFLSKKDEVSEERVLEIKKLFKKIKEDIIPISIIDDGSMNQVKEILNNLIKEKTVIEKAL